MKARIHFGGVTFCGHIADGDTVQYEDVELATCLVCIDRYTDPLFLELLNYEDVGFHRLSRARRIRRGLQLETLARKLRP